ncbi:hypothetical protein EDB82DRAFT_425232 [Fusarium venenatum]|nr:hypothetical protein EDB82DRAFT_425232 [Fusarium venenatum]
MLWKRLLVLSSILVGCCAQTLSASDNGEPTDAPSSTMEDGMPSSTTTTGHATHTINVGAAGHKFTPEDIKADVGDIIEYRFYPDAHWVIRGDYDNPCIPYEYVDTDRSGFSSGPEPVKAITDDAPRYRVRVNNTEPIFFYCGAPGSCVRYHMMGVVNPSKNKTLKGWLKNAADVDYQLTPGEPWPKEEGFKTSTTSAVPEPTTSTAPNESSSSSPVSGGTTGSDNGLRGSAIAGIVVGSVAVLGIIIGGIYLCGRRCGFNDAYHKAFNNHTIHSGLGGTTPVTEVDVGSPNSTMPGYWVYKPTSPTVNTTGQSHHTSPPLSPLYDFPQDVGAMTTQNPGNMNTHYIPSPSDLTPRPPAPPPKELPFGVAELPSHRLQEPPVELPYTSSPVNQV